MLSQGYLLRKARGTREGCSVRIIAVGEAISHHLHHLPLPW